jgi:hypothetical protein
VKKIGQGSYIFCEWDSVQKEWPRFQRAFADLESRVIEKCNADWHPKTFGYLTPNEKQYGRTSILPRLFLGFGNAELPHWRQKITASGNQLLLRGRETGNVIPEDFKVAWIGLAFPNKQLNITELKWQISDAKYGRINIEELQSYNKPAIIFEEGFILNEEESFELYGYVEEASETNPVYQRIVPLGASYFKVITKVVGDPGALIE